MTTQRDQKDTDGNGQVLGCRRRRDVTETGQHWWATAHGHDPASEARTVTSQDVPGLRAYPSREAPVDEAARGRAAHLGHQAAKGILPRHVFAAAVNRMPRHLQDIALTAYTLTRQQPGGPTGYPRASRTPHLHTRTPAHRPSTQWRTGWPA